MLGGGAVLAGMVLGAVVAFIIDRNFIWAAGYLVAAAGLSFVGIISAEKVELNANGGATLGYLFAAAVCVALGDHEAPPAREGTRRARPGRRGGPGAASRDSTPDARTRAGERSEPGPVTDRDRDRRRSSTRSSPASPPTRQALSAGDLAAMDAWFADDTRTVRFGIADEQWGAEEVRRWRGVAPRVPAGRRLSKTRVDLWTEDLAVVTTLFGYPVVGLGRPPDPDLAADRRRVAHHPRPRLRAIGEPHDRLRSAPDLGRAGGPRRRPTPRPTPPSSASPAHPPRTRSGPPAGEKARRQIRSVPCSGCRSPSRTTSTSPGSPPRADARR